MALFNRTKTFSQMLKPVRWSDRHNDKTKKCLQKHFSWQNGVERLSANENRSELVQE